MTNRKFFVGGNWKMNNLKADNQKLIDLLNGANINFDKTGLLAKSHEFKFDFIAINQF